MGTPTPDQVADGIADRIAELLNDHPDAYLSAPVAMEVTTSAIGASRIGGRVIVDATAEDGAVHRFAVRVNPLT
jgi:S-adenosylmethionine synthetase